MSAPRTPRPIVMPENRDIVPGTMAGATHHASIPSHCGISDEDTCVDISPGDVFVFIGSRPCTCLFGNVKLFRVQQWLGPNGIVSVHMSKSVYASPDATLPGFLERIEK